MPPIDQQFPARPRSYNARIRQGTAAGPPAPRRKKKPKIKRQPRNIETRIRRGTAAGPPAPRREFASPDARDRALRSPTQQRRDRAAAAEAVRSSRERYLAKRGRGSGARAIQTAITKGLPSLGEKAAGRFIQAHGQDPVLKGANIPISNNVAIRAVKDVFNLGANIVPSGYLTGAAAVEAARGRPQRLKGLIHQVTESDAVYNAAAAGVSAAAGHTKAAEEHWAKAKKSASEHPGFLAAELFGARGTVGRGAGGLARTGGRRSKRLAAIGTTKRAPKTLPGTNLVERQTYSKDIFRKADEALRERQAARRAARLRELAAEEADPSKRRDLEAQARKQDPTIIRDREIQRRVDEHHAMSETVRRINQGETLKAERELKQGEKAGPVVSLLAQRITRPTLKSLQRYHDDLTRVGQDLKGAKRQANRQLVHDLDQAISKIKSGKVSLDEMRQIADRYAGRNVAHQQRLADVGLYAPEQTERRAVLPFAVRELGVTKDKPVLKTREKAAQKVSTRRGKTAAKRRGETLQLRRQHKGQTRAAVEALRPVRDVKALRAAERQAIEAKRGREAGITQSVTRAERAGKKARTARGAYVEAKNLTRANPFLIERKVTREERVKPGPVDEKTLADAYKLRDPQTGTELKNVKVGASGAEMVGRDAQGNRILGPPKRYNVSADIVRDGKKVGTLSRIYDRESGALVKTRTSIDEAHQRQGIGSRLARAEEESLRGAGIRRVQVVPGTEAGKALTARLGGFKEVGAGRHEKTLARKPTTRKVTTTEKHPVTTQELAAALQKRHGKGAQAAVVSQRPPRRASGADYFGSGLAPARGENRGIGGGATRQGTFDASIDALRRQQARSDRLATQAEGYKDLIAEFGRHFLESDRELLGKSDKRDTPGKLITRDTRDAAQQVADDLSSKGDVEWTAAPTQYGAAEGRWTVIPSSAAKRMQGHMDALSPTTFERGLRSVSSGFQRTVLATSLPWMVGNVTEASLRSVLNRVGPKAYINGRRYLKAIRQIDADQARKIEARILGGGQGAFMDRQIHANLDSYADGLVRDITAGGKALRAMPVAKQTAWLWDHWTHHVFNTVNKTIFEQPFQTAMLGKAIKDKLMTEDLQRATSQAIKEFAENGGMEHNTAVKLGREVDKMYGRYEKFSPDARALLARYTPFGAWVRNAAEFIATMPERHPATTTAGAASINATEPERKRLGLDIDPFNAQPGQLPAWLQGSIPGRKGGHFRVTRFTPFSLATDPLGTAASAVLPQYHSVLYAMNGLDWTGKPLKHEPGTEVSDADKVQAAVSAFVDATVPFASIGKRVAVKGPKSILQSAVAYAPPGGRPKGSTTSSGPRRIKRSSFGGGFKSGGFKRSSGSSFGGSFK